MITEYTAVYADYKMWLQTFLFFYIEFQEIKETLLKGGTVDPQFIKKITTSMKKAKKALLDEKEKLNLPEGLAFMQDLDLMGFSIKKGRFVGELTNVAPIVTPWYKDFDNEKDFYKYEVASYILALSRFQNGA